FSGRLSEIVAMPRDTSYRMSSKSTSYRQARRPAPDRRSSVTRAPGSLDVVRLWPGVRRLAAAPRATPTTMRPRPTSFDALAGSPRNQAPKIRVKTGVVYVTREARDAPCQVSIQ